MDPATATHPATETFPYLAQPNPHPPEPPEIGPPRELLGSDLGGQAQGGLGVVDREGALAAADEFRQLDTTGVGDTTGGHGDIFSPEPVPLQ